MAVALDVDTVASFNMTGDFASMSPRWKRWKRAFTFYITSRGITDDEQKTALLLHTAGMDVQDLFETLPTLQPSTNSTDTTTTQSKYELTMKTLDDYFTPKVNVPYERHIFRQI